MERNNKADEVLAKVAEYYGVSKETIITSTSKAVIITKAKMTLFVILDFMRIPDKGVIKTGRTMPSWFLKSGLADFQTRRAYRAEIEDIMLGLDKRAFHKNAKIYPHIKDVVRLRLRTLMAELGKHERKSWFADVKEQAIRANYTQAESRAIENACRSSAAFMSKFGRGAKEMPMLRGHYERGLYNPLNEDKR